MELTFSLASYYEMRQHADQFGRDILSQSILGPSTAFMGIPLHTSSAFPSQSQCETCSGTGEGRESTYCPKCKGAGEIRIEGVMTNCKPVVIITAKLPRKFEPFFPVGMVSPPRLCRGLP